MKDEYQQLILKVTEAKSLRIGEKIQELWSGYGQIVRIYLDGCNYPSVIIKHIAFPATADHPRGWNTDRSHMRKVKSYEIETYWYEHYSTNEKSRIPICLASKSYGDEMLIIMEDLDAAGYGLRKTDINMTEIKACLSWIANFHGNFMGISPEGLWPIGTYWHLETRPDELEVMDDKQLKVAAPKIDEMLNNCKYKTIVHGDAKLANFCFSDHKKEVAVVDFQYVGGGCGMKDVIYFLGSAMDENECEKYAAELLDYYFLELKTALNEKVNFQDLENEWRYLFPIAWTDFHRFMLGWMPTHKKVNRYSRTLVKDTLKKLKHC